MDIDLLSRMISELIVDHDQVGLPGVGTFVAEMVPATFSDKGYTINPPYRRLSFYPSRQEDALLIDLYAESNQLSREAAAAYLTQYLSELKDILLERKTIVLPGLGRLRATRENALFFVPDADLDIFPEGVGLTPVSLKSHAVEEEPVIIDVPVPTPQEKVTPVSVPDQVPAEPEPTQEEPVQEEPETVPEEPAAAEPEPEPVHKPLAPDSVPHWIREDWREPEQRGLPVWATLLIILGALLIVGLVAFMILARLAPDFIDSILYTPDQLRIINY